MGTRQATSTRRRRWAGPLTLRAVSLSVLGLLALLGGIAILGAIALLLGSLVVGSRRVVTVSTTSAPAFAFPGLVFRAARIRADATGWRPVSVVAGKTGTILVSVGPSASQSTTVSNGQPTVLLFDSAGHTIAQRTLDLGDTGLRSSGPSQVYATTNFAPLPAGTKFVRVQHNVPGGGTTLIPVNLAGLNRLPGPLTLNATRVSGRIRVRFLRVVRGAFLSQIDLEARGFRDPGGEVTTTTQGNTTMQTVRAPQMPGQLTLRTAAGVDLLPEVNAGPVSHGVVHTSIGFKAPPRGTVVTLTIDNYILQDRPAPAGTTRGHWSVTFRMP